MSNIRERLLGTSNYNNTSNIRSRLGINEKNYSIREKLGVSERQNSNSSMKLFKKSSAFDDGYQFGDITSTILSTAGDLTANVGKGFLNTVEGVTDAGQYLLADAAKGLSKVKALDIWDKNARNWLKEKADALEENAKFDSTGALFGNNEKESDNLFKKGWSEELDKNSVSDTMVDSVAQGIGNVAAMAGTSYLGGQLLGTGSNATSFLNSFSSAFGNAKSEAYKNGADDKTALETATISGFAEAISEQFFDALPGMKVEGWGSKLTGKIGESVSKHFGTKAGKATLKVLDSVGEGAEEVISNALSAIGNDIVHYVDNDYNYGMEEQTGNIFKDTKNAIFSNDSLTSFISASLTSAIVNGGNTFITEKQKKSIITAYANDNNMSYEEAKKMFNSIVDINTNSQIDENTNFNDKIDLEEEETKNLLNSIKNGDVDLKNYVNSITSQINEYEALKKQNKLTSEQEIELNELKNRLSAIQNQSTDTSTSIKEEANLPTVQDIVNQEKSSQSGINLPVYNHQSNISSSDKAILPTVNDFSNSNTNMPTSDIKVDMAKISPEILNDIKGFKLGDPSIESYKGSYIKTMLNEVGIKVPTAMNYVSEVRPDMSFTTTKDLTRQQYASIGNALQKLRSVDVTSVNNANYSIPIGNYQYVKSSNANINELRRTASMYLNNTARSNNTIKLLENIIKDRNYIIRFNPNITNEQGVPVNGLITKENGKTIIELNPNADNYVEFLVVHEITHDIATKEMKELILYYAKQDPEFEKSLESLKERYKTNDVSDEIVADVCGELFGNREFIQSVVEKKPNIFKKILNNIRKLAEKIKGTGANEYVNFVENLKEMWEEAYYSNKSNLKKTEYHTNSDIINNIDKVLNNIKERTPVRLRDYTPDILVQNGVKDLPMYENPSHIRKNILTENEARKLGLSINKNDHYHGLGKELYIKAIDSLDNPRVIFKRNNSNNYLILTTLKDNNGNNIVVPIEVETSTSVNNITIDVNRLKSVYGYERVNPNLDKYIKDNIKSSEFTKIYEQKKKPSTGKIPQSTSTANNIPQSSNNVNSNTLSATKYSIPINKNNTQELENSSFYKEWNDYLKENFPSSGTKTKMSDIKLPAREDIESSSKKSKILNPNEISKLTKEDANTTPILPKRGSVNKVNDGNSHFAKNIKDKVNMLNVEQKAEILSKEDVRYYDKVTNKESLEKAFKKINDGGSSETLRWVKQDSKNANATDVAEGWILLKQYADNGDYDSMVEVAKKMREIGTTAGQTVQAFNIMERMTPEGMVKYAQSELSEAYDRMVKNKSKEWIDKYREDFDLKPDEVKFIMDTMQEVQNMEDGYDKRVKLAEIQKLMTDKLPPEKGAKIRSWMRISMLFNPKTQVRNVAGNALIMPVNSFGDLFSSYADKLIAKKTGVRTTGTTNIKAMLKGIKKGAYEATNDYKKGINTKDMEGNRFEISDGKSFSEKNLMGRTLNRTESLLNYVMDVGDRVFSEAAFENSLQNQLVLNNTTEITQEMIDIAHQEALSRTWNDNNNYTRFVLGVRKGLNKLNVNGYGLGDVLIPFAKTPANLTKAIVDYSPAGLISTINKGINLKRSLANGQYTATMQHEFVQSLGKATAGTMLYILGIALAKAGITSGDSDDDKDTANFLKNTLGINSYSIKIGGKSFTYDWAQPLAAPLSITANVVNSKSSDSKALLEGIVGSLDSAGSILLEQSFLQSINDVLNDNDGVVSGIINEILELPARAVPTFSKQIADLVDGTQRTSFEYGKPIQSAVNSIKAKIPFVSKTLNPAVDTMGREIQKYGGKNNIFNVFLNPANVSTENISESAEEIYRLYKETGETDVMPRVAPYYINQKGEKIMMTGKDRVEYQKISGEIIEDNIKKLINNASYSNMSDSDKANVVKDIVNYSYNIAKKDVLGLELSNTYQKAYEYSEIGDIGDYYTFKESVDNTDKDTKKASITKFLIDSDLNNEQLAYLYGNYYSSDKVLNALVQSNIPIKEYIKFNSKTFESDYYANGKTVPNSRKNKVIKYINSLNLSISQKAMLIKMEYSSFKQYDNQIVKYVNNIDCSSYDKKVILKTIGFTSYDKDIINTINSKNISVEEKTKELEELGFKVRNGRVYTK
jgi:hypothetical protein